jgi:uncharacterized protein DUF3105
MGNRREEERERLRQARQERERSDAGSERRRLLLGYGAAGVVGLAVLIGVIAVIVSAAGSNDDGKSHIVLGTGSTNAVQPETRTGEEPPPAKVTNLQKAADEAGCDLRLNLPNEGNTHIPPTAAAPEYGTNPPTSGDHAEPPYQQADGAYNDTPDEMFVVHSLEHGRLAIQYGPDLAESDQLELIGLYDTMFGGALLFPNDNMPYEVAATTWRNLIGCNEYKGAITLDAIRAFGKETWGEGREPVTAFPFTGPTPKEPAIN